MKNMSIDLPKKLVFVGDKVSNDHRLYLAKTKNNGQILISVPDEEWLKRKYFAREEGCICPEGKT